MSLKSAYELASERIIAPKIKPVSKEEDEKKIDFIEIPEFSDREDRVIDGNETKSIEEMEKEEIEKEEEMEKISIQESESNLLYRTSRIWKS